MSYTGIGWEASASASTSGGASGSSSGGSSGGDGHSGVMVPVSSDGWLGYTPPKSPWDSQPAPAAVPPPPLPPPPLPTTSSVSSAALTNLNVVRSGSLITKPMTISPNGRDRLASRTIQSGPVPEDGNLTTYLLIGAALAAAAGGAYYFVKKRGARA